MLCYTEKLRNRLAEKLISLPNVRINGGMDKRLCGNLNISFGDINSEAMLLMLDAKGICASSGAACHSQAGAPSRVLKAIGLDEQYALGAIRFSLNQENSAEEVDFAVEVIKNALNKSR